MKRIFIGGVFILFVNVMHAQNVGIGVPVPQQKLDVNGAIKIGTTTTNQPGAIRFNAGKFEGGDGINWKNFEALPIGGLVASKTYNNPTLLNAGYTLAGEMAGITSYNTTVGLLNAFTWWPNYLNGVAINIPAPPPPVSSSYPTMAVSTGTLMYVVTQTKVYSYNPVTDIWNIVSNQGFPEGPNIKGIWTGSELIFWNGISSGFSTFGSRYNPNTNTWTNLPTLNAPSQRQNYTMIWDGTRMIVWGGSFGSGLNTGAFYDPTTNLWTPMSTTGAPSARSFHTAVWDNVSNRMIVWGGFISGTGVINTGGLYNPSLNVWSGATSLTNAPTPRLFHSAVLAGTEMIIYGGSDQFAFVTNDGGRYNPSSNSWIQTSTIGASNIHKHAASWTGTEMIVSGGNISDNSNSPSSTLTRSYNPATNAWLSLPNFNDAGDAKEFHYSFLISNIVLIWSGLNKTATNSNPGYNNSGYRYFLTNTISSSTTIINNAPLYLYQKN
jgi:hypothetical protein